jgi:hypothetical protein
LQCIAFDRLIPDSATEWTMQRWIEQVHTILNQLEEKERLSLLELAIWKALCLLDMPVMTDYYETTQWQSCNWHSVKARNKRSNASAIIVAAVLPFLRERRP